MKVLWKAHFLFLFRRRSPVWKGSHLGFCQWSKYLKWHWLQCEGRYDMSICSLFVGFVSLFLSFCPFNLSIFLCLFILLYYWCSLSPSPLHFTSSLFLLLSIVCYSTSWPVSCMSPYFIHLSVFLIYPLQGSRQFHHLHLQSSAPGTSPCHGPSPRVVPSQLADGSGRRRSALQWRSRCRDSRRHWQTCRSLL